MRITVLGTGNLGLVVSAGFAENGHQVICVDDDQELIADLTASKVPFYEPGLEELVLRNIEEERLRFTTDLTEALDKSFLVFLCLDGGEGTGETFDEGPLVRAAERIARDMNGYRVIVNKSVCPAGTTERIYARMKELTPHPFDIVVNPQFAKEGASIDDFLRPDRVVIGSDDVRVIEIMRELYAPFLRTGKPFMTMSFRSAELARYAVETMLASRISLMNELANIAEAYGADISEIQAVLMADSRLGSSYLFPGIGFGGAYLPRDVTVAAGMAHAKGLPSGILDGITATNQWQQQRFVERILDYYGDEIGNKRVAIWGASFKPKTDDLRNAPAHHVIEALLDRNVELCVFDPAAAANLRRHYGERIKIAARLYEALEDADGLVIITEWREFHYPDFERMAGLMRDRVIFDGRNLFSPQSVAKHGFRYFSIGRSPV
jgi:UDPglucose 6-dehydrogenase